MLIIVIEAVLVNQQMLDGRIWLLMCLDFDRRYARKGVISRRISVIVSHLGEGRVLALETLVK